MKNRIKTYVVTGILLVFSCYLLPVNAADVPIADPTPSVLFDDTDTGITNDWALDGWATAFKLWNFNTFRDLLWFDDLADMQLEMLATTFQIQDQSGNNIVSVHRDAPLSLDIKSNGDVLLAGGNVFIDKTSGRVGIGTAIPAASLEIQSGLPQIFFNDTSGGSTDWLVGNLFNDFVFRTVSNGTGGPVSTEIMTLDAETGFVGVRASPPTALFHVRQSNGTAKILVEEINAAVAPRTLFQLKNKGNTKFGVLNTDAGVEWAFANPGTGFRLSRQGSGVVEMEIFNNGNMTIAGTLTQNSDINQKTAITEINADEILNLVTHLPVSKWEYKDALGEAHIGPMAQDFYAAFGLGATATGISSIDTAGVALAAIQALAKENVSLKQRVHELEKQNHRIEELVMRLVTNQTEQVANN